MCDARAVRRSKAVALAAALLAALGGASVLLLAHENRPACVLLGISGERAESLGDPRLRALGLRHARAARALRFLLARAPGAGVRSIERFYVYQWLGEPPPRWDSGVIAPDGRTRESYCVLARAAGVAAPAPC